MTFLTRLRSRTSQSLLLAPMICLGLSMTAAGGSPTLIPQAGVTAPASIAELARALKNDVNLIYEYVYTNIEYSPTYGVKKGALGTLLDGRGNDFDQSALMVALLRQSGYTASFVSGNITLNPAQVSNRYGVDSVSPCPLANLLAQGGIPFAIHFSGPSDCASAQMTTADIKHTWVSVTGGSLGGATYVYDPSFKTYTSLSSGINLASAMGYSRSSLLSTAESGTTITSNSIQNVNRANLRNALTGYANNLVSYIKTNMPTATLKDVVGGKYIAPIAQPYSPQTSLPYATPGDVPVIWSDIPPVYRTTLQIQIGGINKIYYSDQIYGHRLTIVYNSSAQPVLFLDGVVQGIGTANANTVAYQVNFPFCFQTTGTASPACASAGYTNVFTFQNVLQASSGYSYSIVNGWDYTGRGMLEFHRRQLQANRAAGGADGSEPVLGETLNMIGYSWLAQVSAADDLEDRLIGTKVVTHCVVGVVGQVAGPYIDMPGKFVGVASLTNDTNRIDTALFSDGGHLSAFEWGNLDQNLAKQNIGAVSTVKLFDIANSQNKIIYNATSSNWSTISPLLSGYSSADLAAINAYISGGSRVILPQSGNITQNSWTGVGYLAVSTTAIGKEIAYKISSNLKGGYTDFPAPPATVVSAVEETSIPIPAPPAAVSTDPVDLSTGAFLYNHDDITIGTAGSPVGLTFQRSYTSSNRYVRGPLGLGWTHGFAIDATVNSDGLKGMGQDLPIDGAAAIVGAYVAQDLFSDSTKPLANVIVASLSQRWFMDQLINNAVNVATGAQTEQFMLLADGSYNPRPGTSSRLSLNGGAYVLKYKDGTSLNFNSTGDIATVTSPAGVTVTFVYNAASPPLLTSVTNGFGRALTLNYNGSSQLTSVSDNASPARTVAFGYDGSGDLISFTDPIGNVTTFSYTPPGAPLTPGLLTQIFYPSNPGTAFVTNTYDSLGRVASQTNANNAPGNNTTWNYYFAGYRSEENDPYGTQHVLYYNPRGKVLFDIADFAGLNRLTANVYDGLDRVTSTTFPEGNSVGYAYDGAANPWANNVVSTAQSPKPGSPLSPLNTTYTYESTFNKPTSITDPRGLVTTMSYHGVTGNLLSIVDDAGSAPHFNAMATFTYNDFGQVLTATDPLGTVTKTSYDSFGNATSVTRDFGSNRLNQLTTMSYNAVGDVISVTDPNGNVATSTFDAARRLKTSASPANVAAPNGLVTALSYDPDSRVIQTQQSANGTVLRTASTTYTPTGKPATATDGNGNITRSTYDLLDRTVSVTDAMDRATSYAYDALSRRTQVFNTAVQATPLLQQSYTPNGLLASLTDANGNATSFAYDGFDRLATTTYPGGSTEALTYDADNNVLSRKTRANGTITSTYDTLNRLATKTPPSPAPVVSYGYDLAGRMTSVSDTSAAINPALPPSPGTPVQYATSYAYDSVNRPISVAWDPAPAAASPAASAAAFSHSYNKTNQRTGYSTTDNSWWFYPAATPSTVSYSANALNQYTAVGAVTPNYDANGNLTGDGTFTYGYDAENRLTSASGAGNTASYAYDAQGRRKLKTVNGTTTVSVTDAGNREVLEYHGTSGAILRWYAHGLGSNDVLNQMNVAASTRVTLIPDVQGSIIGTLDSSSGTLSKQGYLPYGASASAAGTFAYTGQRIDAETSGLYYYRARMYATTWGRFLQPDPIGYQGGSNLYAYVGNDPLNLIDPQGLTPAPSDGWLSWAYYKAPLPAAGPLIEFLGANALRAAGMFVALPTVVAGGMLAVTSTSTGGPEQDQPQFVVRAGAAQPDLLETGTRSSINGYGFSVQTSPKLSPDTLASEAANIEKYRQYSVTTVQQLEAIPGVTVNFPTPGAGAYHGTVNVPNPPPPGIFTAISGAFTQQRNPYFTGSR